MAALPSGIKTAVMACSEASFMLSLSRRSSGRETKNFSSYVDWAWFEETTNVPRRNAKVWVTHIRDHQSIVGKLGANNGDRSDRQHSASKNVFAFRRRCC